MVSFACVGTSPGLLVALLSVCKSGPAASFISWADCVMASAAACSCCIAGRKDGSISRLKSSSSTADSLKASASADWA